MFTKRFAAAALSLLLILSLLAGCSSKQEPAKTAAPAAKAVEAEAKGTVKIGGKNFTEQLLLAKMTALLLKENGYDAQEHTGMGSSVVRQALENGQVDLYWEYTGTGLVVFHKKEPITDAAKAYDAIKQLDAEKGLIWLDRSRFNNTYVLMMRKEEAQKLGITSISDLAKAVQKEPARFSFATNAEFYARPDGYPALQKAYDFKFTADKLVKLDSGLVYSALKEGKVDVSMGFATDGRIPGFGFVNLLDDKQFFPAYNGVPVVRKELAEKNPTVVKLLNQIVAKLDDNLMAKLNAQVDVDKKDISDVARTFLTEQGLIK